MNTLTILIIVIISGLTPILLISFLLYMSLKAFENYDPDKVGKKLK